MEVNCYGKNDARGRRIDAETFKSDLIMFLISSFLPGEYVLRIFPLICKGTQFIRFSLSLLAPLSAPSPFNFEGRIYGIYNKWQDFARILKRGHLITALVVEDDIFQSPNINSKKQCSNNNNNSHPLTTMTIPTLSSVRELILFSSKSFSSAFLSLDCFPKLTKLDMSGAENGVGKQLLAVIWKLFSLTSLVITDCNIFNAEEEEVEETIQQYIRGDNDTPAFAYSLHSLETNSGILLDLLAPYCHNLTHIRAKHYHEIMINNPRLTSLSFSYSTSPLSIDLTPHTELIKFDISTGSFSSRIIHSHLEEISFYYYDPSDCRSQFLSQCPQLKRVTVRGCDWQDIVKIISVLNPNQCQLQLHISEPFPFPSVDEIEEVIYKRGFIINDELLMQAHDAPEQWTRIMKIAPNLKHLQKLHAGEDFDKFLRFDPHRQHHPHPFTSLQALSLLDLNSNMTWNEEMLSSIATSCSTLKTLRVWGSDFSGILKLHSFSLRTVDLFFFSPISGFDLQLPNVTHLYPKLCSGESILLQGLLNGDDKSLVHLPLLCVLSLNLNSNCLTPCLPGVDTIQCKAGHRSLVKVKMRGEREFECSKLITFRNMPSLREIDMGKVLPSLHVVLDIPGNCDFRLDSDSFAYNRQNYADKPNFVAEIAFDPVGSIWVESKGKAEKQRKRRKRIRAGTT